MEIKKAIIKIFNISNELGDKFIQVLKGIEARKIPIWYEKQLKLVTEHQMLYEDGFIMNYDFFYDDIMNKKWKFENSVMSNSTLYLNFSLSGGTNFSAIFCIARMMDINFNNIQVEDPYFGVYSLSDDWISNFISPLNTYPAVSPRWLSPKGEVGCKSDNNLLIRGCFF